VGIYRFLSRCANVNPAFLQPVICARIVQRQQQLSALHYSVLETHFAPGTHVVDQANTIPVSTRWHRVHGRQTRRQQAERQQLLTPQQEKALVDHLLRLHKNGHPKLSQQPSCSSTRLCRGDLVPACSSSAAPPLRSASAPLLVVQRRRSD
jgi:hypothetical protein